MCNIIELFDIVIANSMYVNKCKSNIKKNVSSLSYLIDRNMSQSDCIKLGIALEKISKEFILFNKKNLIDIRSKNLIGKKEKDHLFIDETKKIIYYAEIKSNLTLDTEKTTSTIFKCNFILDELKNEYPNYEIKMYLVSGRYLSRLHMPKLTIKKFNKIAINLVGINDYFTELDIGHQFDTEEQYKIVLNNLVNKMFV